MLLAVPAFSLTVEGLYTAQVPIKDQSSKQVLGAKKIGLAQVIVKVTGQTQSLNHSGIRAALKMQKLTCNAFPLAQRSCWMANHRP